MVPPEDPTLVGRGSDLESLVAALTRPPAMAVVEGEPGIGKSRLVREALKDPALAGRHLLRGHARPGRTPCPLAPVIEALGTARLPPLRHLSPLCGVLRSILPDLAHVLPPPPPPLDSAQLTQNQLLRATAELLGKLGPAVLVIEDLQWADEATLELLAMIGAHPAPYLSVAVTANELRRVPGLTASRIRLEALTVKAAERLAGQVLGGPQSLTTELADVLYARNGGVPFVVREDVRLLRGHGLLGTNGEQWTLAERPAAYELVPPAVAADVAARRASLGAQARAVLDAAAVLGEPAEPELVAKVAGMDAESAEAAFGDAIRCGLLCDHAGRMFRHELARLAVYQAISGPCRRRLHAVAARELAAAGRTDLALRAGEHHRRAGDVDGWVRSAEAAAAIAMREGEFSLASDRLREVLRAGAVAEDRRAEVAIKLGWAGVTGEDTALLAVAQTAGTPAQRAELRLLRVWPLLAAGSSKGTDAVAAEMHAALGDLAGRPELQAIALAVLALPNRLPEIDVPAQMAYLDQARALLDRTADPMAHTVVLTTAAHLLLAIGSPAGWPAVEALPARGDSPEVNRPLVRGLHNAADAALHLGHYSRALELARRGLALAGEGTYGLRVTELRIRWAMGEAGAEDGELADDLYARLLAAQIRTGRGQFDVVRPTLRAVAEEACEAGELAIAAYAAAELNRAALTGADRRLGHSLARQVLDALAHKQIWVWAAPLLPFAQLDLVRAVLPAFGAGLDGLDAPLARAALDFAEARVREHEGDAVRALDGYRRARLAYAALPDVRMAAHGCAAEVRCQVAAGREPDAGPLREAWRTLMDLGAVWDANRLKQQMRAAGLPVPHRRGRPGYGNRLSPREREIAELAASGHTNRDIAASLYLSDRTVKYHLANATRKLGVTGRRQLRDALRPPVVPDAPADQRDHTCRCERCGRPLNPSQ